MRRLAPRLLACALLGAGAAQASPFTVERFLAQERLGRVSIDPSQRWLVAPIAAADRTAPRWDLEDDTYRTITQLRVFDLVDGGAPKLYPQKVGGPDDWGYSPGPYSPSGAKMAVTRARGRSLEVGVLDLATGQAVWTGLNPIDERIGRAVQWRSDTQLVVAAKAPEAITLAGLNGWQTQARWIDQWRATDEGRLGVTVMGSGRYLDRNPVSTATRLVTVSAATGQGRVLTEGDFLDVEVAPGGRYAALYANGEAVRPDPAKPRSSADTFRRHRLTLIDLENGEAWSPCPKCDLAPYLLAWSPRGSDLLVYARDDTAEWAQARYWRITPGRRTAAPLDDASVAPVAKTTGPGYITPRADWMGETPLIQGRSTGSGGAGRNEPDWFAWADGGPVNLTASLPPGPRALEAVSADAIVVSSAGQLYRIGQAGGASGLGAGRRVPGPGFAGSERLAYNSRPSVKDLVVALDKDKSAAPAILKNGRVDTLGIIAPDGESLVAVAPRLRLAATVRRDAHGVQTVSVAQPGRPARSMTTVNADLSRVDFSAPRPIPHKGPRGEALTSWLYLPPERSAGLRAPLVVVPYPSAVFDAPPTEEAPPIRYAMTSGQILAGRGYAVLVTSLPVDERREPTQGLAGDVLAIVDAAAAAEPTIDAERLAVWGHSYGGYAALAMAAQSPRFKAVIAVSFVAERLGNYSPYNLVTAVGPEAGVLFPYFAGYAERGQGRMQVAPWKDPQIYVRNSPMLAADKVTAPALLIMGGMDKDPGQLADMFGALFRQDKDALSVFYPGEGHVFQSPANVADYYARIFAFLDEHIGPGAPSGAGAAIEPGPK